MGIDHQQYEFINVMVHGKMLLEIRTLKPGVRRSEPIGVCMCMCVCVYIYIDSRVFPVDVQW